MATGGWQGLRPDLLEQAAARERSPRGRRSIDELLAADATVRLERDLQAQVEALLKGLQDLGQILAWHHAPDVKRKRGEQAGFLDLTIGVRAGLVVAIELKRPDGHGRLSAEQLVWLRCHGERGAVCTSLAEVMAFLQRWGIGQRRAA